MGRSKSVGGNKSTNNNNNNGNNGNNKALSAKLLTLSATNRKLEQRCQRNEALLQRMARDRDAVLAQVRRLGEERGLLLKYVSPYTYLVYNSDLIVFCVLCVV